MLQVFNDVDFSAAASTHVVMEYAPIEVTLAFRIAQDVETVSSLEGDTTAQPGDHIMTGIEGEHYVITAAKFPAKYKDIVWDSEDQVSGVATKIVDVTPREVIFPTENFQAKTWAGIIDGTPGCALLRYGVDDYGIVQPHLFTKLYVPVD